MYVFLYEHNLTMFVFNQVGNLTIMYEHKYNAFSESGYHYRPSS